MCENNYQNFIKKIIQKFNSKIIKIIFVILLFIFSSFSNNVFAVVGVPTLLHHQGRLLNSTGDLLGGSSGTNYCFKFSLFTDATVGGADTQVWPSGAVPPQEMTVNVKNGILNVDIGDTSVAGEGDILDFDFNSTDEVYLNIQVVNPLGASCASMGAGSYENLSPRQRVVSAGYAINSKTVGGFAPSQTATNNQIPVINSSGILNLTGAINAGGLTLTLGSDDATGDIFYRSSSGNFTRLGIGTDGKALVVSSGLPSWQSLPGGGDALTTLPLSQFAATTSLQLENVISDETGSGALVFADSPVFTTPNIGNATGSISGNAATATNLTGLTATILNLNTLTTALGTNAFLNTAFAPIANPTFTGTVTIPTPFTLGTTSVTSTGTQLNYLSAATGTTGTTSTNLVFSTSPILITPALGTPSVLVGTNITGTAALLTAGLATNLAGGLGGSIPYQTALNTTAFLTNGTAGQVLQSNGLTSAPSWVAAGSGATLQSAYNTGNTITTTDGRNIIFTFPEVTTPTSLIIENQDTAGTDAERIFNSIASGTLTNGLLVEQTGAGTITNAIQVLGTAGAISNGILIAAGAGTIADGIEFTGTFTNIINSPTFDVNNFGDLTSAFTALDGSTTTNGTGSPSTSMIVTSVTNFNVGNYIRLDNSGTNCTSGGPAICYAKVTAINVGTNTLTISPQLIWGTGRTVDEWHIPEVGGTDVAQTPLINRYGRGYFIGGTVAGNGSTFYDDGRIYTSDTTGEDSGSLTIITGSTTTSGNSGSITIDSGPAAGTAGIVAIGTTNASAVTIGAPGVTTTINGTLTLPANSVDLATAEVAGILSSSNGGSGVNNAGTLTWGSGGTLGTNAYSSTAFGLGDMILSGIQTVTGDKTFNNGTLSMNNVANSIASNFTNTNTAAQTYTLQNASGTLAFISDIPSLTGYALLSGATFSGSISATNLSGTNTGNETAATIKTALGITTLSGSNTGDSAVNSLYSGLVTMTYPGAGIAKSTGSAWATSISGTSSQFVKGDGSLDSSTYLTSSSLTGYALLSGATFTGAISATNLSGTNTGDNSANTTYANDYRSTNFTAGTNYQAPITLTTTNTSGAATLSGGVLNIPNYANTLYTAGTGLTLTGSAFSVNPSQNITTLSNLSTAGLVQTTAGGLLSSAPLTGVQVTTALGFTPYNSTNPSGYISNATGLISAGTNVTLTGSGTSGSPYVINAGGGSGMVYPGAGIAKSTGSAWATSISGTSSQFVKGDGSLDSTTYVSGTPWTSLGYLTGITSDSPLSGAGTSASHLVISQANTSTAGYLSSTDWNTFNNKQVAGSYQPLATVLTNTTASYTTAIDTRLANTSGTNTGNETAATIKTALGITTLSGSNTGDQTLSGLGGQPLNTNLTSIGALTNAAGFLYNNGSGAFSYAPAGAGDMILSGIQTVTGDKTFNNGTLSMNNVANSIASNFTNTNTAAQTYTLQNASGTLAFISDITGTNSGTNTGDNSANTNYASDYRSTNFVAGTNYQAPITLTTSGTSGAATFSSNTLNIPNYANTLYTAGTGLTLTGGAFSVNTSQNITTLSNLTTAGLVQTTAGGVLSSALLTSGQVTTALGFTPISGNQTITLTGDITGSGTTSIGTTLATVATAGTTGSSTAIPVITINAKGLTTSITTAAVIAPAGTLTGATLASGVTASSLTSVGTLSSLAVTGAVTWSGGGSANANSAYTFTNGFTTNYPDTVAIEALAGTSGFLKKTAANTWTLDTNTYLTSYTETDPVWAAAEPNYFNLGQSETVTGIPAFNGGVTGTSAPFTVDSTFLVTNLNADLLDGQNASAFLTGNQTITLGGILSGSGTTSITAAAAAGYYMPSTTDQTNWGTAYTNRITSLTTTGSGAATLSSNVLNIPTPPSAAFTSLTTTGNSGASSLTSGVLNVPNYTLAGLGGQPLNTNLTSIGVLANAAGFLYNNGSGAFSYAPAGAGDMILSGIQTVTGDKTFNNGTLSMNNVANSIASNFTNTNTAAQTYTLQNASGTLAFISDIPSLTGYALLSGATFTGAISATNLSGTNTGNETATTIKTALGITTLSGSNTGDSAVNSLYSGLVTMTYPSAGIALSTGSAWGTSITDNSANWNTAYTNRITSLTTTGSGAATLSSNVLNIPTPPSAAFTSLTTSGNSGASTLTTGVLNVPNYTLAGLGGIGLTALSSTATGLTYTNTTGVFSLTSGYAIPTTTQITNWGSAYTNMITSLTTTNTSGAATLSGGVLNIPNYANTLYTAGTGLTLTGSAFSVNTSQNITTLSNLTTAGLVQTTAGGLLSSAPLTGVQVTTALGFTPISGNQTITLGGILSGSGTTSITAAAAAGYYMPSTTDQTNWGTAYTNRITSLTTTGSGAATLSSNVLNIPTPPSAAFTSLTTSGNSGASNLTAGVLNVPNYTLAGLGGQPALSGTGFVKISGTTISYDNSTYLTTVGTGVANQITYWSGTNTLGSLTTATYPSLTELSYVKGVTSGIQSQLNAKGAGTVTSVNTTAANNGVTATWTNTTTTPGLTIGLGAITPTSVNGVTISGSAIPTLAITGTTTVSGANTGDNSANTTYASDYRSTNFIAGTNYIAPYGSTPANYFLASPSGSAGVPTFRGMTVLDMPVMTATVGGAVPTPPNDASQFLNGAGTFTVPGGGTLQSAYNAGNTITTTDARNISITLADTATDQTFEITQAGTALAFRVNDDGIFTDSTPFVIDATGNVGIGNSAPGTKLDIVGTTTASGAAAIASLLTTSTLTNSTASGFQFGSRNLVTVNGGTAGTEVGQFIRMTDSTSLANTVRGLEVQAYSGTNNAGINTGIATFGKTFGIQAETTAQAGSVVQAAAVFADLNNYNDGSLGNAIRAYSNDVTSANLVYLTQETSAFSGDGLLMNFAAGSGTFSGNFADFQNNSVSKFKITSAGNTFVNLAVSTNSFGLCHEINGAGVDQIKDCVGAPTADYAEKYPVEKNIEYGDVVAVGTEMVNTYDTTQGGGGVDWKNVMGKVTKLVKADKPYQQNVVGIVVNNYGDFTSAGNNIKNEDNPMPVALNGRVLVKISNNGEAIEPGDYITASDDPGKAIKATKSGTVIGKALEAWTPDSGVERIMILVEQGYYNGPDSSLAGLTFGTSALFNGEVTFTSQVEFSLPPLFNNDTGGFAIIKQGDRRVVVTFENSYIAQPVVNATMSFETSDNISDADAQALFDEGIQSIVANKSQSGFTILINKNAPRDLRFSWTALAIKDAKIYESIFEGLTFTPSVAKESTLEKTTPKPKITPEIISEPTPEVTPTPKPTKEVIPTPEVTPTSEVILAPTPEIIPTPEVTPTPEKTKEIITPPNTTTSSTNKTTTTTETPTPTTL